MSAFLGLIIGILGSWVIPTSSWWLGAYYIFMFLWTWGVFSGIQRYFNLTLWVLMPGLRLLPRCHNGTSTAIRCRQTHHRKPSSSPPYHILSPPSSEQSVYPPSSPLYAVSHYSPSPVESHGGFNGSSFSSSRAH